MKTPPHRETAKQSHGRNGVTHGTQGIHEAPPLAACVRTLPEAVQTSLSERFLLPGADPLFVFARAVKAFEVTINKRLSKADLDGAFALWWSSGQSRLLPDSDFDTSRLLFLDAFSKVRAPLGSHPLAEAIRRADAGPPPPEADRYPRSPKLRRLVAVCFHLQALSGDNPFFIGARDAAKVANTAGPHAGLALLNSLVREGVLTLASKGTPGGRRASRYRFNATTSARPMV